MWSRKGHADRDSDRCQRGAIPHSYLSGDFSLSHRGGSSLSLIYLSDSRSRRPGGAQHRYTGHLAMTHAPLTSSGSCDINRNRPIHTATYRCGMSPRPWSGRGWWGGGGIAQGRGERREARVGRSGNILGEGWSLGHSMNFPREGWSYFLEHNWNNLMWWTIILESDWDDLVTINV